MTEVGDQFADMLAAALAAYDAGLCVVRTAVNGTKKPLGTWLAYQAVRPSREQVTDWFHDGYPGMGVVCGAVSGDLEMIELEGAFMSAHKHDFFARIKDAGLELLFRRLQNGYHEESPGGGRHFLYRVTGAIEGNLKLAQTAQHQTLIETRGEGGFVVLAPSHGPVHPSGKPWKMRGGAFGSIPLITPDDRSALFAVARSFNEAPPAPRPPPTNQRIVISRYTRAIALGASWVDAVCEHLAAIPLADLLEEYGWARCYNDAHGRILLRRPGKEEGVSGGINEAGRFLPFSSSTPFATGGQPPQTFDALDIVAAYEHGGDRMTAARAVADAAGIVRQSGAGAVVVIAADPAPDTPGEVAGSLGLDDAAWNSRPVLAHVRQAARSRLVAPSAVLGCLLARVAAWTPPSTCLPPLVGTTCPLSMFVALRGSSGAGKSSPAGAAHDLLPAAPPGTVGPLALGSGEGLVEAFLELVEIKSDDGKVKKAKRQVHHGALFTLDEGQLLAEIGNRRGATILPVLRTAWSGNDPGQANASVETRRSLGRGCYAVGLISLWQDEAAATLLADVAGGTPQRFVFFDTDDPEAGDHGIPDWPGPLQWAPPARITNAMGEEGTWAIELDPAIRTEVLKARIADLRGEHPHPLDAHRRLNKLKVAGVLTVLDGRHDVNLEDWALAERIMADSDAVRSRIIEAAARATAGARAASDARAVERSAAVEHGEHGRALARAARAVARYVLRNVADAPVARRDVHHAIASRDRQLVSTDEVLAEAERLHWVARSGDGWTTGDARPS